MTATDVERLGSIFADPAAYADPVAWHAAAARIRAESPILRVSIPEFPEFWAITKHADVMEIERHPELFTNAPVPVLTVSKRIATMGDTPGADADPDGRRSRTRRTATSSTTGSSPATSRCMQARIDELARQAVDQMAALGGECDFVNDVALHFPLQVILSILGLPADDYGRMLQLTQELFGAEDPDIERMGDDASLLGVLMDFVNYFTQLANDRRAVADRAIWRR